MAAVVQPPTLMVPQSPGYGAGVVQAGHTKRDGTRLALIDGLRGLAALYVTLFHLHRSGSYAAALESITPGVLVQVLEHGHLGVEVFFVLSGFVMAWTLGQQHVDPGHFLNFALRRSVRLDPPYWITLLLVMVLRWGQKQILPDQPRPLLTFPEFLGNMFYLQDLLRLPNLGEAFWTLCLEFQFYLFFGVWMVALHALRAAPVDGPQRRGWFLGLLVVSMMLAAPFPIRWMASPLTGLFVSHWYMFLTGVVTCWTVQQHVPRWMWFGWMGWLAVASVLTRSLGAGTVLCTGALVMLATRQGGLQTWLKASWVQFLGRVSYSMYLLHAVVGGHIMAVGWRLTGDSPAMAACWFVVALSSSLISAGLFYRYVEAPFTLMAQRLKRPSSAHVSP